MFKGIVVPAYSLEDILQHRVELPKGLEHPLPLFKEYLRHGYINLHRKIDTLV